MSSRIAIILRKEFGEIFRDRRTLMSVVISPLVVTPLMFALIGLMSSRQAEQVRSRTYRVGAVGAAALPGVMTALRAATHLRVMPLTRPEAERRIRSRSVAAVVVFPPESPQLLAAQRTVPIQVLEDIGDENSQAAGARLDALFEQQSQAIARLRLAAHDLPPDYATPFVVSEVPIPQSSLGLLILTQMLPYLLIVSSFTGSIYAAFDQVAGEKERGTLETLLVSPASRRDIVLGKFGAVVCVCLLSSLLSLVGVLLTFTVHLPVFDWLARGGLHLGLAALGVIGLVLLPLAVLFAGLLLTLSTWARNQKEAQTYLAPLLTVILIPAFLSMTIGVDAPRTLAFVPILNASLIIKQALNGRFDPVFIGLAFAASAMYAALALAGATRLFQKESVLIKA